MTLVKINDAIIGLRQSSQPILGSISYSKLTNENTVITIKTGNKIIKTPLNQIKIAVFKLDAETYGFIFNGLFYYDKNCQYWDEQIKRLTSHKLEVNL